MDEDQVNEWMQKASEDEELKSFLQLSDLNFSFLLKIGDETYLWHIHKEEISVTRKLTLDHVWDFTISIPGSAWSKYLQKVAPPFHNTLQAMVAHVPGVSIEGNRLVWAQSIRIVERLLLSAKEETESLAAKLTEEKFSPETIKGHYVKMYVNGEEHVTYYEEAGEGQPIIFLHTAGSDSRQYKYLLGNKTLQKKWRMIAFDLPYHGKSSPPDKFWEKPYKLTTKLYTEWILGFLKAADLYDKKPVISGSSMGGAIVLHLAARYGELFRAVVSMEGGFGREGRRVNWTNHLQVHGGHFLSSWVNGLMSPESPEYFRRLVLWEYAQGGPGVYQGDTYFYSYDWPKQAQGIGKTQCPLWIFCGEYDYSCTPEQSEEAANRMDGTFIKMEGMGHFPPSENPAGLLKYVQPVLDEILEKH
ncbi:alpha/beta fold hydrolase [Planococcus salinus]|uniref:Alpha/beta hydrolase n=1 Tax=Planococcus salinus TaxID=1848460 RepID=A0A3M8P836_9BACL|nr:alpha/beta hydrolase [Planococcus salinus]RNF39782.1 alpha/beta hydrolase [Planococcus salinus]